MTDPAPTQQLAADVREAIHSLAYGDVENAHRAVSALDALTARITDLEAQVEDWKGKAEFAGMPAWIRLWEEKEAAEAQVAAMGWFPPPEWKDGWEGLVTAYDYDRKYVGCIGRETWDWLLASGITEAQVAALTQERAEFRGIAANEMWLTEQQRSRAAAAEAEVERLTEALRGIASQEPDQDDVQDADPEFVLTHPRVFSGAQVARAVLAGRKDTQQ